MAFDSFIKMGDVKGEASDAKHKDEILRVARGLLGIKSRPRTRRS